MAAFVFQSCPADAILLPGSDWGMPYAPEDGFVAFHCQPDSRVQSLSRQSNWLSSQPKSLSLRRAIFFASAADALSPDTSDVESSPVTHCSVPDEPDAPMPVSLSFGSTYVPPFLIGMVREYTL